MSGLYCVRVQSRTTPELLYRAPPRSRHPSPPVPTYVWVGTEGGVGAGEETRSDVGAYLRRGVVPGLPSRVDVVCWVGPVHSSLMWSHPAK